MTPWEEIAAHAVAGASDIHVVVGPMCWQPSDGTTSKVWYFIIATSEPKRGFRCDQIFGDEQDRAAVMMALATNHKPVVIHDMDDELAMVRLCEILWPGKRVAKIRAEIEAERKSRKAKEGAE